MELAHLKCLLTMEDETTVKDETLEVEAEETQENEELTKAQELAKNQKIRAEKAEKEAKELRAKLEEKKDAPQGDDLSQKDLLALVRADVHDDDIDRVAKFAKLEGISIADALKHSDLKAILSSRAEARKSAEATAVKPARNGAPKVSDEVIIAKAAKGEIPAPGSPEAEALFWARRGGKR